MEWLQRDSFWCTARLKERLRKREILPIPEGMPASGVCFISDPQLRTGEEETLARRWQAAGGVILTGTVEEKGGSHRLLEEGRAQLCRIPVHCTDAERKELETKNDFHRVIPYHTPAWPCKQRIFNLN